MCPVVKSGDAVFKWRLLRIWTETGAYPVIHPEHHQGRWMLNLPARFFMEIFGTSHWVYYIYPLLTGFICTLACYFIGSRLKNKFTGMAACLLFLLYPYATLESVQMHPMVPGTAFILLALGAMIKYLDTRRWWWPLLAGILLGLGYGCKVTVVYWFVPFGLFLVFADPATGKFSFKPRFPLALFLLAAGGLLVAVGEFFYLNSFFNVDKGRVSMLFSGHFKDRPDPQYVGLIEYLFSALRPLVLKGKYFMFIPQFILTAIGIISAIMLWRRSKGNAVVSLCVCCFTAVYLIHCYAVYKIFPFLHPERNNYRYYIAFLVLGAILFAASLDYWKACGQKFRPLQYLAPLLILTYIVNSIISIGNPWSKGEHIIQVFKQDSYLQQDLPVLQKVRLKDLDSTEVKKYAAMYLIMFAPVEELLPGLPQHHLDLDPKNQIYQDADGRLYRYLWGGKLKENAVNQVAVVEKSRCRVTQLELKRWKKR